MFLSFALLLFLLCTSAVAAPVHEDVTLTRREQHQTLAELAGELHGAIFVRDDLPFRKASQGSLVDWPVGKGRFSILFDKGDPNQSEPMIAFSNGIPSISKDVPVKDGQVQDQKNKKFAFVTAYLPRLPSRSKPSPISSAKSGPQLIQISKLNEADAIVLGGLSPGAIWSRQKPIKPGSLPLHIWIYYENGIYYAKKL